jgi:DNA replication protein DnaC
VARQCAAEQVDYARYLLRMTELELLDRERRATDRRIRQTKFPVVKTVDSLDFLAIPTLNKTLMLQHARCEFLGRRENVLLLGNSGTGKTHIALALGLAACQRGHRVRFTTASALVSELIEAYQPYDADYIETFFEKKDPDGRRWMRMDLEGDGVPIRG